MKRGSFLTMSVLSTAIPVLAFVYTLTASYGDVPKTYEVRIVEDLVFAKVDGVELLLDLHLPEGVENPPLVMSIHGGAWKTGDRKTFRLTWLVKRGYAVANIEYRMSQEAVFPAQIHDCKGALRWLRARQKDYGYDASKVVVAGFSAGGYLATLMGSSGGVAKLEGSNAGHLDESSTVQGVIDYYGPADFIQRSKSQPQVTDQPKGIVYQLLGRPVTGNEDFARLASPVTHAGPGDPPILIIHGSVDRHVLPAQSQRLLEVWKAEGLEAHLHIEPGKGHGWSPPMPQEQQLIIEFLAKHLSGQEQSSKK